MKQEKITLMLDDERGQLVLEATWEISSIAALVGVAVDHLDQCDLIAIKGAMHRLRYLNNLIMGAVGDPMETTEELKARLGN
ncbi:MAG: hypothetical protein H0X43_04745 [Nitrosospira sp.]|nr:hypothetical protein [Nitrosospira sp.]